MTPFRSRALAALLGAALLGAAAVSDAVTLRWAGRGDMHTTDPHAQNENLTNNINSLIYEFLVTRDKQLGIVPALAESWTQVNPTTWRFKLRQASSSTTARRSPPTTSCSRFERAQSDTSQLRAYAQRRRTVEEDRRPHRGVRHAGAQPR